MHRTDDENRRPLKPASEAGAKISQRIGEPRRGAEAQKTKEKEQ